MIPFDIGTEVCHIGEPSRVLTVIGEHPDNGAVIFTFNRNGAPGVAMAPARKLELVTEALDNARTRTVGRAADVLAARFDQLSQAQCRAIAAALYDAGLLIEAPADIAAGGTP